MKKRYLLFAILPIVAFLLFGKSTLYRGLAVTERVDADVLIVEGWTNPYGLEAAAAEINTFDYRRVIVASLAFSFDSTYAYEVSGEGSLVFDFSPHAPTGDSIVVSAASQDLRNIPAHFRLWVNDSLVGESWTRERLADYAFTYSGSDSITTVAVEFDNDGFEAGVGDRNLYVQSVRVGERTIYARTAAVRLDRGQLDGSKIFRTDHRSEADQAAAFLRQAGVSDSLLVSIAAPVTDYDRTYATAVAAQAWFARRSAPMPLAINVGSAGSHARRSRLLYEKAFGDHVRVGVVSLPRETVRADNWWKTREGIAYVGEQILKYLYAWLLFWPDEPAR